MMKKPALRSLVFFILKKAKTTLLGDLQYFFACEYKGATTDQLIFLE